MDKQGAEIIGNFRYRLWRHWDIKAPHVLFVMLNPSTADAQTDDPTIRKCIGFAKHWHFGGIEVANLYAYRATDPAKIRQIGPSAIGRSNHASILRAINRHPGLIVVAWGAIHPEHIEHADQMTVLLRNSGRQLHCLGHTIRGFPWHPLRVAYARPLEIFCPALYVRRLK